MNDRTAMPASRHPHVRPGQLPTVPGSLVLRQPLVHMLQRCHVTAVSMQTDAVLAAVEQHVLRLHEARGDRPWLNLALATAISQRLVTVLGPEAALGVTAQGWLKAAALYFIANDDDDNDIESPIGIEDDAEVLNACLTFAKRPDLCLRVQDYDHG